MAAGNTSFPESIDVKPSAVIFNRGKELISDRKFETFRADSQEELDILIR